MKINRRFFIKSGLAAIGTTCLAAQTTPYTEQKPGENKNLESAQMGCLVDTTLCIGCRKCEEACNRKNNLPRPELPFTDTTVFRQRRRPSKDAYTVVNEYPGNPSPDQGSIETTHCKVQCLHCLTPSCVSACLVGAMTKQPDGAVVYNEKICLGCRYCMVACPFEIPAYEYDVALTPRVRKCQFCADFEKNQGANPACAAACPTEALVFGKRSDLLNLAKDRIKKRPDRYIDYIYGEKEAGGTAWLYLTGRPANELELLKMPDKSPALTTEKIQHGIFKYGILPLTIYGVLAALMWRNRPDKPNTPKPAEKKQEGGES